MDKKPELEATLCEVKKVQVIYVQTLGDSRRIFRRRRGRGSKSSLYQCQHAKQIHLISTYDKKTKVAEFKKSMYKKEDQRCNTSIRVVMYLPPFERWRTRWDIRRGSGRISNAARRFKGRGCRLHYSRIMIGLLRVPGLRGIARRRTIRSRVGRGAPWHGASHLLLTLLSKSFLHTWSSEAFTDSLKSPTASSLSPVYAIPAPIAQLYLPHAQQQHSSPREANMAPLQNRQKCDPLPRTDFTNSLCTLHYPPHSELRSSIRPVDALLKLFISCLLQSLKVSSARSRRPAHLQCVESWSMWVLFQLPLIFQRLLLVREGV